MYYIEKSVFKFSTLSELREIDYTDDKISDYTTKGEIVSVLSLRYKRTREVESVSNTERNGLLILHYV